MNLTSIKIVDSLSALTESRVSQLADAKADFRDAMRAAGIPLDAPLIADGEIQRFYVEGDRRGSKNGWYVLDEVGVPHGAFGNWRTHAKHTWRADGRSLDPLEVERLDRAARMAKAKAEHERLDGQQRAARYAQDLWDWAPAACEHHPYLVRKQIKPHELRQRDDVLMVPLCDIDGELWSLQRIDATGLKRFLQGGRTKGCFSPIGLDVDKPAKLLICEGFATGVTLHEITGAPVLCAMSANNLEQVCLDARARWPNAGILVCGDDDRGGNFNPGRFFANAAAAAIGAEVCFPDFRDGEPGSDFNDLALLRAGGRQ